MADRPQDFRELAKDFRTAAAREAARVHRDAAKEAGREIREAARLARGGRTESGEPGTRQRIQQVALELFTERGYEATSLREIAERLGVTKAALYYHFKTKDEIVQSLVDDQVEMIGKLVAWAKTQQRGPEMRAEMLRRYAEHLHERDHHSLMKFFERNQSSMQKHKAGSLMRERMYEMLDLLVEPGAPLPTQIRCSLAIFALHSTWFTLRDPSIPDAQRREAALEVALDLIT